MKENYQPPEHLKDFISVTLKEVWSIMVHSTNCIHKVMSVMEVLLEETLKCTHDFILCFWRQVLFNLDYKVDNEYGRSRCGVNFAKDWYQNNGRPFEYEMDKYPNLYEGVLIDELIPMPGGI